MKIRFNKDLFKVISISVISSIILTLFFWLFSLISWSIVFILLTFLFIPITEGAIKFYKEKNCIDLMDFCIELTQDIDSNKNKIE